MSQLNAGETFTDVAPGKTVTSTRLNNHVAGATLLNGAILDQTEKTTPVAADVLLLGDSTLAASGIPKKVQVQNLLLESQRNGSQQYVGTDSGGVNTYVVALSPAATALTAGMVVRFKASNTNTGPSTLAVNALTAKALVRRDGAQLSAKDILAGQIVTAVYDGSYFQHVVALSDNEVSANQATENFRNGCYQYATDSGTANAKSITLSPTITSLVAGLTVRFKNLVTNTGATTLSVNGFTATMQKGGNALAAYDMVAGELITAVYDGTYFQINGANRNAFTSTPTAIGAGNGVLVAAAAHSLGVIPTRVRGVLRCVSAADLGYAIGDEVDLAAIGVGSIAVAVNATDVSIIQYSALQIPHRTTGVMTACSVGRWNVVAYLNP